MQWPELGIRVDNDDFYRLDALPVIQPTASKKNDMFLTGDSMLTPCCQEITGTENA